MSFWKDLLHKLLPFGKAVANATIHQILDSVADKLKGETDEEKGLKPKEKEFVKKGIDLLNDRAKVEIDERL